MLNGTEGGSVNQIEELSSSAAATVASLIGIGCQSGDVVMGLSGVRREGGELAFVFADAEVASVQRPKPFPAFQ